MPKEMKGYVYRTYNQPEPQNCDYVVLRSSYNLDDKRIYIPADEVGKIIEDAFKEWKQNGESGDWGEEVKSRIMCLWEM